LLSWAAPTHWFPVLPRFSTGICKVIIVFSPGCGRAFGVCSSPMVLGCVFSLIFLFKFPFCSSSFCPRLSRQFHVFHLPFVFPPAVLNFFPLTLPYTVCAPFLLVISRPFSLPPLRRSATTFPPAFCAPPHPRLSTVRKVLDKTVLVLNTSPGPADRVWHFHHSIILLQLR